MKFRLSLHLIAQILAQSAVIALVPVGYEKYSAALLAIIGVLVAFFDSSAVQVPQQSQLPPQA